MPTPPLSGDHVRAFGNQLVEVHIWLREQLVRHPDLVPVPQLAALLNELGDGRGTPAGADVLLDDGR